MTKKTATYGLKLLEATSLPTTVPVNSAGTVRQKIAERAYLLAEKRQFTPGRELEDWLQAEAEVLAVDSPRLYSGL